MRRILVTLAIALAAVGHLHAQWIPTQGPYGGSFTTFVKDSAGVLFVAGRGPAYRSLDTGITWTVTGPRPGAVEGYVLVGTPDGALLALVASDSIYRSTDRGSTWVGTSSWTLPERTDRQIAIDPATGAMYAGSDSGVIRSLDDGISWQTWARVGVVDGNVTIARDTVVALARLDTLHRIPISDSSKATSITLPWNAYALSVVGGDLWASAPGPGVLRSTDLGATWERRDSGLPRIASRPIRRLANGDLVLLHDNVYLSTDDGATWTRRGGIGIPYELVSPAPGLIAVATSDGVVRSTDRGDTWSGPASGIRAEYIQAIEGDAAGDAVYISTDRGLYRTLDDGATWTLLRRSSVGVTFSERFTVAADGSIFTMTSGGEIFRSTDRGSTWEPRDTVDSRLLRLGGIAVKGDTVVVTDEKGRVFTSIDAGATWPNVLSIGAGSSATAVAIDSTGGIIVVNSAGTHRSSDAGAAFALVASGTPIGQYARPLSVAPDGAFYLVSGLGLMRMAPGDSDWQAYDFSEDPDVERALAIGPSSTILVGRLRSGVVAIRPGGAAVEMNVGLEQPSITALYIGGDGIAWAGTNGAGLFTAQLDPASVPVDDMASHAIALDARFGADGALTVVATLEIPATARIALFDIAGRLVRTASADEEIADVHRATIDLGAFPRGAYVLVVEAGDRRASMIVMR